MTTGFDYDSPWKEALRLYLHSFMRLCFPHVERVIDWSRPSQFLDKELQQEDPNCDGDGDSHTWNAQQSCPEWDHYQSE